MNTYRLTHMVDGWRAVAVDGPPLDADGRVIRVGDRVRDMMGESKLVERVELRWLGTAPRPDWLGAFPWRVRVVL